MYGTLYIGNPGSCRGLRQGHQVETWDQSKCYWFQRNSSLCLEDSYHRFLYVLRIHTIDFCASFTRGVVFGCDGFLFIVLASRAAVYSMSESFYRLEARPIFCHCCTRVASTRRNTKYPRSIIASERCTRTKASCILTTTAASYAHFLLHMA